MTLSQNQFSMIPVQGQMDLRPQPAVVSAQVDTSSAGGLVAGQAVKIVDSTGGVPKVVECSADTDDVWGFIPYSLKDDTFAAGDRLEIAAMRDNVMYMTASAAISRNAKVMIVVASKKVATATSGKTIIGRAYDAAAADGDLIRVVIDLPGSAA